MDNRRTTIVINKKFQYQYSLLIAAMAVLLINGFLIIRILFPGNDPLDLSTPSALGLAVVELILIGGIWYGSLKASHRIAGPMYVVAREIDKLGSGDLTARVNIREKDMFQPEAERMNASIAALQQKIVTVKGLTEKLQQVQSAGGDTGDIVTEIANELSNFNTAK
jgi:methyl-accepting chemotaxis protein